MIGSLSRSFARVAVRPAISQSLHRPVIRTTSQAFTRPVNQTSIRSFSQEIDENNTAFDEEFVEFDENWDQDNSDSSATDQHSHDPLDAGKWSEIIDPSNPPRLSLKHYEMLTKIAGRKPQVSDTAIDPVLDESIINIHRMLETLSAKSPGIKRDAEALGVLVEEQYRTEAARLAVPPPEPIRPRSVKLTCRFCAIKKRAHEFPELKLEYTNLSLLYRFINLRGMIYPRRVTGNCMKHQRKLANSVKRARYIGLLSYTSNWSVDGIGALDSIIQAIPDINISEMNEIQSNEEFFEEPVRTFHAEDFAPKDPNALPTTNAQ